MKDWELIEAYRMGNEEAFATLVQRYYALVYGAACRQICDRHLAEDVTQSVFLLFARKAGALSPATAIGGWFLRPRARIHRVAGLARRRRHSHARRSDGNGAAESVVGRNE